LTGGQRSTIGLPIPWEPYKAYSRAVSSGVFTLSPFFESMLANPIAILFAIITLGTLLGQVTVKGISLGTSGVIFVALAFGHFGLQIPAGVSSLGVVLFVYAVGLQAGPRFFKAFRSNGLSFAMLAIATLAVGFITTMVMSYILNIEPALGVGLYTGSLTTTPGLAAALEALDDPNVSVGYGIAYPFGVVGVVLFAQLLPKILGIDMKAEAQKLEKVSSGPQIRVEWLAVKNPQIVDKTIEEISSARLSDANFSRVCKGKTTMTARSDIKLELGDKVRVVGTDEQIKQMTLAIGPRVEYAEEGPSDIATYTVFVTEEALVGHTLHELKIRETYGIVITRHWRNDHERVPTGSSRLEIGDTIRIVGAEADAKAFIKIVGNQERKLQETHFLPLSLTLLLGVLVGLIPIPFPGGSFKLGAAGGPLLVALLAGHFSRIGPISFRVPVAARFFIRELGLIFFLAGAGTKAGANFVEVISQQGPALFLAGVVITLVPMTVAFILARWLMKLDILSSLGAICGSMTSTPGLGAVCTAANSDYPALSYATVYPVALIIVTLLAKFLAVTLMGMVGGG
jgi:putative transport protein